MTTTVEQSVLPPSARARWLANTSYGTILAYWRGRDSLLELMRQRAIREEKEAQKKRAEEVNDLEPETVETFTGPVTGA